ncbi:conjugal transfer protein TraD [Parashewanella hymeniacidonis]|uniref:conjugal transfer protein TraD n=1 Tax=Parashewanella hymeniacidonis TaxID=2807618 RepID=UPI001EF54F4B|nr:conjugal transfer protein TraD [Parashewanella hymeniacidonis]
MNSNLNDKLMGLNIPGSIIEMTKAEAEELGAFEENALTEDEALEANEAEVIDDDVNENEVNHG